MYKIIKKIMDDIAIVGYVVSDEDGNEKSLKEEDLIRLCHRKLLLNATTLVVNDNEQLIIDEDLNKLESTKKTKSNTNLKLICRLVSKDDNGNQICKGYIAKDNNGKNFRLDTVKTWKLAKSNNIEDVEAIILNKKKVLRSQNNFLERLPVMDA